MLIHESLNRLERACDLLVSATLSEESPDSAAMLLLRRRFAVAFRSLLLALVGGLRAARHRALHARVRGRAETLRIRMMSHTMAWQPAEVGADPAAFRAESESLAGAVRGFIADTRTALERAGVA